MDEKYQLKWLGWPLLVFFAIPYVLLLLPGFMMDEENMAQVTGTILVLWGFPAFWGLFVVAPFLNSYSVKLNITGAIIYLFYLALVLGLLHDCPLGWSSGLFYAGVIIAAIQPILFRLFQWFIENRENMHELERKRRESDYIETD
ncbi:hypothetical protein EU527_16015 [Candidatus Thorarchaeota archaeon]|nr:MAG: hypothetical protein EU527_16015 [Candidatus Thorarchaeota archaeon]